MSLALVSFLLVFQYITYVIPVLRPSLPTLSMISRYIERIDTGNIYTNYGPLVRELEIRHAERLGVDPNRIVAVANATLAIQGCISISDCHDWVCPDFTFVATAHAVIQSGKNLYLSDVRLDDWQLDLANLVLYSNSIGIVPVMPFGAPVDFSKFISWKYVVVDAAASLGAPIRGLDDMLEQHFVVFSLHATKVLGSGEGAIVVCGNASLARELRCWINFGFDGTREALISATNSKMCESSAAYGLASLDGLMQETNEWLSALDSKFRLASELGLLNFSDSYPGFRPYWIYDILSKDAGLFINFMRTHGIETRSWWPKPISEMKGFAGKYTALEATKNSSELSKRLVGLPLWRGIGEVSLRHIAQTVTKAIERLP